MGPSLKHEERVKLLDQLAHLAGCTVAWPAGSGLSPDVFLASPSRRLVFLGEAKRSETPGNSSTERRLRRYLRVMRRLQRAGFGARVAICADPLEAVRWTKLLGRLAASEHLSVYSSGSADLAEGERVVWIDFRPERDDMQISYLVAWAD